MGDGDSATGRQARKGELPWIESRVWVGRREGGDSTAWGLLGRQGNSDASPRLGALLGRWGLGMGLSQSLALAAL